jgi:hypothetical protein
MNRKMKNFYDPIISGVAEMSLFLTKGDDGLIYLDTLQDVKGCHKGLS